ncbi:MAG TPA: outer membrane protein assembly factor BamA [Candidatus Binatia bacterium]|jgi:outer membrane protein insertion porin family|nr:outer membrane protein assembly factor BamA [Candidatus Binatia bacterium]
MVHKICKVWMVGAIFLLLAGQVWAANPAAAGSPIAEIKVVGNDRVEEEAIRVHIASRPGEPLRYEAVDKDVRSVYEMGFFSDVEASVSEENGRTILTYQVHERPLIREVRVEGNKGVSKEDFETALKIHPRTILNPVKIRRGIEEAKKAYEKKGFLDAEITYRTEAPSPGETILTFTVNENDKVGVKDIVFEGNQAFSGDQLRAVMATRKKNFLSRFLNSGVLNNDALKTDVERLTAFYYDHGYINVRIDEPRVARKPEGLYLTVRIEEGEQYQIGEVGFGGEVPGGEERAKQLVTLQKGQIFKASTLRDDVFRLTGYFSDQGYAFVNVEPDTDVQPDEKIVNITYQVDKGPETYIDRIDIAGNTKTRDKVIRRELRIQEQSLFSATGLQFSRERVQRLGFFEDVNLTTQRGARNDLLNVLVDVKEAQTGAFSIGAGFNSSTSIIASARVQENNLMGRGQQLVVGGSIGTLYRNTTLSFTDPYLMDTPITLGVDLFDWRFAYEDFDRSGLGGGARIFYPLSGFGIYSLWGIPMDDVRLGLQYQWERSRISNFDDITPDAIRAERGTKTTGTVTPTLLRNTLNNPIDPTGGSMQQLSFGYAGLGGGTTYKKGELEARFYFPVYHHPKWGAFTWMTGGFLGYGIGDIDFTETNPIGTRGREILRDDMPLFDRYFPGGINSIRGFGERSLGPREAVTVSVTDDKAPGGRKLKTYLRPIGGSEELVLNNELSFPLVQQLNLKGVVFSDIGNAFTHKQGLDFSDLRYSVGAGVRWRSPFGPIRIEMGKALNAKNNERTSTIHFSFGGFGGAGGGSSGYRGSPF